MRVLLVDGWLLQKGSKGSDSSESGDGEEELENYPATIPNRQVVMIC